MRTKGKQQSIRMVFGKRSNEHCTRGSVCATLMPSREKTRRARRGFHHRGSEDTKLGKDREIGVCDVGNNPLDGLSALCSRSTVFGALKGFIVNLGTTGSPSNFPCLI